MESIEFEDYPRTVKISKWTDYLGRDLYDFESIILHNVQFEKQYNKKIVCLNENSMTIGNYIPELTNLHGNCLFECLVYHGIGENIQTLRKGIAYIMYQFRDFP